MKTYKMNIGHFDKKTETFKWSVFNEATGEVVQHGFSSSLPYAQDRMLFFIACRTAQDKKNALPDRIKFFHDSVYQDEYLKELGIYEIYN